MFVAQLFGPIYFCKKEKRDFAGDVATAVGVHGDPRFNRKGSLGTILCLPQKWCTLGS